MEISSKVECAHLEREVAAADLPGVEGDPGAGLEQPLQLRPGVGLQVRGVAGVGVAQRLAQVEQHRLLAAHQPQLAQTLTHTSHQLTHTTNTQCTLPCPTLPK